MSQTYFMVKDTILVLDENDNIGSESKKKSHVFSIEQPRDVLHRLFRMFISDDSSNELLLLPRLPFPSESNM